MKEHGNKQYDRMMQHKDVRRCSIGAMAMYLLYHFE